MVSLLRRHLNAFFHFPNRRESYVSSRFLHRPQRRRARPVRAYVRRHHRVRPSPFYDRRHRRNRSHGHRIEVLRMSNGFYFGMGGVPSVYDEYPDEQPILVDGYVLDLDTLTAGGELVTIEEFTEAANDAGLDKDIMEDCLEELRVLWQERDEEAA
nr:MAG TPA: hypothetical protein [Caudoviricetes sp.]